MRNVGLDEAQVGIKIAGRNINNLRYVGDTTLMAESKEDLKSLLMKVKEESEKADSKLNIQKTKIMASNSITLWQTDGETVETVTVSGVTEQQVLDIYPSCKCLSNPHLPKRWKSLFFEHIKNSSREGNQCLLFLCVQSLG